VFGDGSNAGHASAVENAAPELRAVVTEIAGRHDEDGGAALSRHGRVSGTATLSGSPSGPARGGRPAAQAGAS